MPKCDFRCVRDVKKILGKECALQHTLLVCDLQLTSYFLSPLFQKDMLESNMILLFNQISMEKEGVVDFI